MYTLSSNIHKLFNDNKVILANLNTGQWIKISKESYDVINILIKKRLNKEEILDCLSDEGDIDFVSFLIDDLIYMGILTDKVTKQFLGRKMVSFELTNKCNLNCIHCCMDASPYNDEYILSTEEIFNAIDKTISWEPDIIMLSGGEPLVRSDLMEILKYLYNHFNKKVTLSTNGTLINDINAAIISKCVHQVDMSIDGVDEKSSALIRGPGVFKKVINAVKILQKFGMKNITLSMSIGDRNADLEEQFIILNKNLGTTPIVRVFAPVGRGRKNISKIMNKDNEELYIPKDYLKDTYDKVPIACACKAGSREIIIRYQGDIYPCPSFIGPKYKIANIKDIDSLDIIDSYNSTYLKEYGILKEIDKELYVRCKNCKVNIFCWTCPGQILQYSNNKFTFLKRCSILKPLLYKRVWNK